MKSPLEIKPKILVWLIFILVILVLHVSLIMLGIEFNPKYYGIIVGICLGIFFFFIYPRISRNKEFLVLVNEDKEAAKLIRQSPVFYKIRIAAVVTLFLMLVIYIYLYFTNRLQDLEYIGISLVFVMMMYCANLLRKHKETAAYGEKLANIVKSGYETLS